VLAVGPEELNDKRRTARRRGRLRDLIWETPVNRALSRLAVALLVAGSAAAHAADTLFWSETGPSPGPFLPSPSSIQSASLPGGTVTAVVSGAGSVKGPNGVEFLGGRVWWPDQQLGLIQSAKPDGTDLRSYGDGTINPYDVDLEGSTLYWSDQNGGRIFTIDTAGAAPWVSTVLMSDVVKPVAIDVVGDRIYWSEVGSGARRVRRANLDGTGAVTLLSGVDAYDLEVTDQYIYYANNNPSTFAGQVLRTNLDGSGLAVLATGYGLVNGIDVTDDAIFLSQFQFDPQIVRMALDGSGATVIHTAPADGSVLRGVAVLVAVPEPSTLLLSALGLVGLAAVARRRR
jgi:hypothetical protein